MADANTNGDSVKEGTADDELQVRFDKVLRKEREAIRRRRESFLPPEDGLPQNLTGLVFSGGGIRSATFNLGILQALAAFDSQHEAPDKDADDASNAVDRPATTAPDSNDDKQPGHRETGILQAFDYLSTVSGGGYIGSWLSSWIYHESVCTEQKSDKNKPGSTKPPCLSALVSVQRKLARSVTRNRRADSGNQIEPQQVAHLRQFSNYLSPQVGLFSCDTWTLLSIYLRNFLLNLLPLVLLAFSGLIGVLLMVKIFGASFSEKVDFWATPSLFPGMTLARVYAVLLTMLGWLTFARCLAAVKRAPRSWSTFSPAFWKLLWVIRNPVRAAKGEEPSDEPKLGDTAYTIRSMTATVVCCSLTAVCAVPFLAMHDRLERFGRWICSVSGLQTWADGGTDGILKSVGEFATREPALIALMSYAAMLHAGPALFTFFHKGPDPKKSWSLGQRIWSTGASVAFGTISGAVGGLVLWLCVVSPDWNAAEEPDLYVVLGPPIVLMTFFLGVVCEVGFSSRSSSVHEREWWARFGSWMLIIGCTWLFVTSVAAYSGAVIDWLTPKLHAAVATGAISLSAVGAWLGQRSNTRNSGTGPVSNLVVRLAPGLFVVGLVMCLSWVVRTNVLQVASEKEVPLQYTEPVPKYAPRSTKTTLSIAKDGSASSVRSAETTEATSRYPRVYRLGVERIRHAIQHAYSSTLWLCLIVPAAVALVLSTRFDINQHSLNRGYANRLIRCYLGATNPNRRPQATTGFDPEDDFPVASLSPLPPGVRIEPEEPDLLERLYRGLVIGLPLAYNVATENITQKPTEQDSADDKPPRFYDGPLHLINTALNVFSSHDLSRQERRAESFVISPLYTGYVLAGETQQTPSAPQKSDTLPEQTAETFEEPPLEYFVPTAGYADDIKLGSAFAISGAAASPNMGYHTMPSLAALMTLFNVRTGWWLPNTNQTDRVALHSSGPWYGLRYVARELFSRTTRRSKYIYTSDGGHFENLGAYELIRRRCRFIIVTDATADPLYQGYDFAGLVRKCRIDFGVEIEISTHGIEPDGIATMRAGKQRVTLDDRISGCNYALGIIRYPPSEVTDEEAAEPSLNSDGLLIYIKSSMAEADAKDQPDLREYALLNPSFPHEPTLDQFFSESQFESYRLLGDRVMTRVLKDLFQPPDDDDADDAPRANQPEAESARDADVATGERQIDTGQPQTKGEPLALAL
ncbi:patatin-like phospholipase family protein [Fuerstiella marisgermanici]|uniref:Patatin-like phospholipase n=1 Tax=Fuerstiella marisgermanici TaxID=1891926 RepID=A0A1P8WF64_9PLAN|nr:patatin-like phospholipase family protein [Fuerstiella marisgermanici]APZ92667.1 Patatin-like phospholipase [Fuerstiella marisgermanici]